MSRRENNKKRIKAAKRMRRRMSRMETEANGITKQNITERNNTMRRYKTERDLKVVRFDVAKLNDMVYGEKAWNILQNAVDVYSLPSGAGILVGDEIDFFNPITTFNIAIYFPSSKAVDDSCLEARLMANNEFLAVCDNPPIVTRNTEHPLIPIGIINDGKFYVIQENEETALMMGIKVSGFLQNKI